MSGRVLTSSGY